MINKNAFEGNNGLTSVILPEGVTDIGRGCFSNCTELVSVSLPKSLTGISPESFSGCTKLPDITIPEGIVSITADVFSGCSSLKTVTLPNGLRSLGKGMFRDCISLTDIIIPEHVMTIPTEMFSGCSKLAGITLPAGLTGINDHAFFGCTSLTDIEIPEGLKAIGDEAFFGFSSLKDIKIPDDMANIGARAFTGTALINDAARWDNDALYLGKCLVSVRESCEDSFLIKEGTALIASCAFNNCSGLTNIVIPDSVVRIGQNAFSSCSNLRQIKLPDRLLTIGSNAFADTEYYKDENNWINGVLYLQEYLIRARKEISGLYTVRDGTRLICSGAFLDCSELEDAILPESVVCIGHAAFRNCNGLQHITLPSTTERIGNAAFVDCSSLDHVVLPDRLKTIGSMTFSGCAGLTEIRIPEGVAGIGANAFSKCTNLSRVTIPDAVKSIGSAAFKDCIRLESVEIPGNVRVLPSVTFANCSSLMRVVISEGLKSIDKLAFYKCTSLASVMIPQSVVSIAEDAFEKCDSLTQVVLPESLKTISQKVFPHRRCMSDATAVPDSSADLIIEYGVLKKYNGPGGDVVIPEGITEIGESAFAWCGSLTGAVIPKSVRKISEGAFYGCSALHSLTISEGVTEIGKSAFKNCEGLIHVTLPEGLTHIGKEAFQWCRHLTKLELPASLQCVESQAFYGCDNLKTVDIRDLAAWSCIQFEDSMANPVNISILNPAILCVNGTPLTTLCFNEAPPPVISNFGRCLRLTDVTIPEGVTSIGANAFSGCQNLKKVTIPASVKEIGSSAFADCPALKEVTVPPSVKSIGNRAFQNCKALTQVDLFKGLQNMGEHAFSYCPNLKECTVPSTVVTWGGIPAKYADGAYYTENKGQKEILEVFAPGKEEYTVPTWAAKLREDSLAGNNFKRITVSAGAVLDEKIFGASLFARNNPTLTGSFLETHEELPAYYIKFLESAIKTPELMATRMLYQSGKQWNEALTTAAQNVNKAAIVGVMARMLEEEGDEKLAARFADAVLDYLEELGAEEMKTAYGVLQKGGFKALRKLVLDEGFQDRWLKLLSTTGEPEAAEQNPIEALVNEHWKTTEATKKLRTAIKEGVCYKGTDTLCPPNVVVFLVSEYATQLVNPAKLPIGGYQSDYAKGFHISELADQVAAALDTEQLRGKLEELAYMDKTFRNGFVLALARYGSGKQISHLCSVMREHANWGMYGVGGRQDVVIARGALLLSETREAMMALDKTGTLGVYAGMRGTDADTIRDTVLADFGFDQEGKKTYDLGGNRLSVSMDLDLALRLYDENAKKYVKTVPKKNADPARYEAAKADVSDLKKNIKRVITHRRDSVFDDFLSGAGRDAVKWKKTYLGNPVLRALARLIVWEQESKTFTLADDGAVDCAGNAFMIEDSTAIRVAHPLEMDKDLVAAWQSYFISHSLKQPFEQVWEPVYDPAEIKTDRYSGAVLPIYRFSGKDKHGIHSFGLEAYSEDFGFELDDCDVDYEPSVWRIIPGETDDETYTLSDFRLDKLTRRSNHIIFVLDKWTILDRIEKDDSSISVLLPIFTLAQLTEFIRLANEKGSSNCLAVLMDYKNKNFEAADPFAEFTLD